ncbi:MAG: hotdog fold domain-containing protein [Burkholderiaceae bacterium]
MPQNHLLALYNRMLTYPMGRRIFSRFAARKARYFTSISPIVEKLEANCCTVSIRKRKAVSNHIGTVHVIAIANGLEMAMGFMAEASIPTHLRWIPKGMSLEYVSKGATDITCTARVAPSTWRPGEIDVPVVAKDTNGNDVVTGTIRLWVTEKPAK